MFSAKPTVEVPRPTHIGDPPRAAYVHVPFCRHRCGYCDFTLIAGRDDLRDAYLDALEREIDAAVAGATGERLRSPVLCSTGINFLSKQDTGGPKPPPVAPMPVAPMPPIELETLFFGGGTPSHLTGPQLKRLFAILRRHFRWECDLATPAEISLEANPLDLTGDALDLLADLGVNRLSIGVQSFDADALRVLERDHSPQDVRDLVPRALRRFPNFSVDLIFGVPGLTLDAWRAGLNEAIDLGVTHISTYGLTFEPGTAFWTRRSRGELRSIDEELERDQYAAAMDDLTAAGFEQYEISNFARPGFRCRHNETYWRGGSYYGFGPGAARHIHGLRETNLRSTLGYLARLQRGLSPTAEVEELNAEGRARERVFLGLRMNDGVSRSAFQHETGFTLDELAPEAITRNCHAGWLDDDGECLRLTRAGRFVADRVVTDFL